MYGERQVCGMEVWTRKKRSTRPHTWERPITSAPLVAKKRLKRTPANTWKCREENSAGERHEAQAPTINGTLLLDPCNVNLRLLHANIESRYPYFLLISLCPIMHFLMTLPRRQGESMIESRERKIMARMCLVFNVSESVIKN